MFNSDLLLAFLFMALLFLRQVAILKKPNKINYAPLMLGIGAVSSVIHFIIQPDTSDVILLLRESFFPLLVALLLYIVMNILHQTQESENSRVQSEFSRVIVHEITQLKEFILELEARMNGAQQEDRASQEEIRENFKNDIKTLDIIKINQERFLEKFQEVESWNQGVKDSFAYFSEVQLPNLDSVMHRHIEMLRIAEQDHYNKLTQLLQKSLQNRSELSNDMQELKKSLNEMKSMAADVAKTIADETLLRILSVTKAFEFQMGGLKSHTESLTITLQESENRLDNIRVQSEMLMKQMRLSSEKMNELEKQNSGLHNLYISIKSLVGEIESIKSDYLKAESQLIKLTQTLVVSQESEISKMQETLRDINETLSGKIDNAIEKFTKHFEEDMSKNVQLLAKRAQVYKGYTSDDEKPKSNL